MSESAVAVAFVLMESVLIFLLDLITSPAV